MQTIKIEVKLSVDNGNTWYNATNGNSRNIKSCKTILLTYKVLFISDGTKNFGITEYEHHMD